MDTRNIRSKTAIIFIVLLVGIGVLPQTVPGTAIAVVPGTPQRGEYLPAAQAQTPPVIRREPTILPTFPAQPPASQPEPTFAPVISTRAPDEPLAATPVPTPAGDQPADSDPPPVPVFPGGDPDDSVDSDDSGDRDDRPGLLPCAAARMDDPPRFLSLPFPADPRMEVFHGWLYTHNRHPQCGIDYGMRDNNGRLLGFPVLASADGEACGDRDDTGSGCVSGFGDRVLIRHTVEGRTYYTYYGHLEYIAPEIPIGSRKETVRVRRGQVIGFAGDTGTYGGSIHLHYGIAAPWFGWYDPYDLWTVSATYPDPLGTNGFLSGPNYFWTTNPPSITGRTDSIGDTTASIPAHAVTAGQIDMSDWTEIIGRDTGIVEVWVNGERRGEVAYGPELQAENSTFSWTWDTTKERNGPHTVVLRVFSEDSSVTPRFSVTDAQEATFLISVQNPRGFVYYPTPDSSVVGTVPISGWVTVENSTISAVEIWIDGEKRGNATYGLPHRAAGGEYGFLWEWDTIPERAGEHTIIVKAIAENGGSKELSPAHSVQDTAITVDVRNWAYVHRWAIR